MVHPKLVLRVASVNDRLVHRTLWRVENESRRCGRSIADLNRYHWVKSREHLRSVT